MKKAYFNRTVAAGLLLFALIGCREITTIDRPYQRVLINNFSTPIRTLLPARDDYPNSITIRVSGTVSQPVALVVNQLTATTGRQFVRRDTLVAGTYTNAYFGGDYYSKEQTELVVTGAPGATGSLSIDWYLQ
ncbi:hypothetical protein [Spirosoma arcticum]